MQKKYAACFVVLAIVLIATAAFAGSVKGWGQQEKGFAGKNAQLKGEPFVVPDGVVGTITSVNCDGNGFWVQEQCRGILFRLRLLREFNLRRGSITSTPIYNKDRIRQALPSSFPGNTRSLGSFE